MKILVLGSTGFIGSAVTSQLVLSGHKVVAIARESDRVDARTEVRVGDLAEPETLRSAVTPDIDAIVHAAAPLGDWTVERASVSAMLDALGSPDKSFLYVSGTWVLGPGAGDVFDESSPPAPIALVSGRETVESLVLDSAVNGIVLRPGIAFGHGGGIPGMLVQWASQEGRGRHVGAASVTWPVVHVEDLARLVDLALDSRVTGILHGVSQSSVAVADLAVAADRAAGGFGVSESWSQADAAAVLGAEFAEALATSQAVNSDRARQLGWTPVHNDVVREVSNGSYVTAPV